MIMKINLQINKLLKKVLKKNDHETYNKLNKILSKNQSNNQLRFNLAIIEERLGLTDKAVNNYKLLTNTEYAIKALTNLYLLEIKKKNYKEALILINNLLLINHDQISLKRDKALVLYKLENFNEAEKYCLENLIGTRDDVVFFNILGLLFHEKRESEKAEKYFLKAYTIEPNSIEIINNIAGFYREEGNYQKSIELYEKALLINPDNFTVLNNLAKTYFDTDKLDEAEKYCEKADSIQKDNDDIYKTLSLIFLKKHMYSQAWEKFDGRLKISEFSKQNLNSYLVKSKLFKGNKLKKNDKILVIREQGVGDEILYSSMYKDLVESFDNVTIECDHRLRSLFKSSLNSKVTIKKFGEISNNVNELDKFDVVLYAGSLGKFFRKNLESFDGNQYIFPPEKKVIEFKNRFDRLPLKHNVGISWKSFKNRYAKEKSLELNSFANIFKNKECNFINIQYGNSNSEVKIFNKKINNKIINLPDQDFYNDFESLSAILKNLDLFVTVSNSTAHLAGSLGVKTILIKPANHAVYHYWNQLSDKTPWYKSLTLVNKEDFLSKNINLLDLINR